MQGEIVKKVEDKGFGFIKPDDGGKDLFFHATGMSNRAQYDDLNVGQRVEYTLDQASDRPRAIEVAPI